jgi:hypothetical protein
MNSFFLGWLLLLSQAVPNDWLPDKLGDLVACSPVENYAGKKLFDYMDGGAEVYLAYGFSELSVRTYQAQAGKITVEIYRMDSELGAFGIFSTVEGRPLDLGVRATAANGLLAFFKGTVFVRLLGSGGEKAGEAVLTTLAKVLIEKIPGESKLPAEIERFPAGYKEGWPRYLPAADAARTLWMEGEGEILLCAGCRAFATVYPAGDAELVATRVEFPASEKAKAAFESLVKKLGLPRGCPCSQQVTGKAADDSFSALRLEGKLLFWVSGAETKKEAEELLGKLK